jgi:hypothetical protein
MRIKIVIDEEGNMTEFIPLSSIGLEPELIRALKNMKKWIPTKVNEKATSDTRIINFEIR